MPSAAFESVMRTMVFHEMPLLSVSEERRMGSISSDVAKNTASMVPTVMEPVENSVAAAPEMPHCGTMPSSPPRAGPARRE